MSYCQDPIISILNDNVGYREKEMYTFLSILPIFLIDDNALHFLWF